MIDVIEVAMSELLETCCEKYHSFIDICNCQHYTTKKLIEFQSCVTLLHYVAGVFFYTRV